MTAKRDHPYTERTRDRNLRRDVDDYFNSKYDPQMAMRKPRKVPLYKVMPEFFFGLFLVGCALI